MTSMKTEMYFVSRSDQKNRGHRKNTPPFLSGASIHESVVVVKGSYCGHTGI